jgi:phage shock protein C
MNDDPTGAEQQSPDAIPSNPPKRLYRSSDQKMFLGVAGGLAEYFDLDPTLVRILFVVATLLGLAGVVVYAVLAIIMPDEDSLDLEPRAAAQRTLDQAGREIERGVNVAVDKVRSAVGSRRGQQPTEPWTSPPPAAPSPPPPSAEQPTTRIVREPETEGTDPAAPPHEPGS